MVQVARRGVAGQRMKAGDRSSNRTTRPTSAPGDVPCSTTPSASPSWRSPRSARFLESRAPRAARPPVQFPLWCASSRAGALGSCEAVPLTGSPGTVCEDMDARIPGEVTRLLRRTTPVDRAVLDELLPLVYRDLHALARARAGRSREASHPAADRPGQRGLPPAGPPGAQGVGRTATTSIEPPRTPCAAS